MTSKSASLHCGRPATPRSRPRGLARGFTLVETIVALVVFGFLAVGLLAGQRFGVRAWQSAERATQFREDAGAVDRVLRRLIENMRAASFEEEIAVEGERHTMAFATLLPLADESVAREVDVAIGVDLRGRLLLRWKPHRLALTPRSMTQVVLLDDVDGVDFSYWTPGGWRTNWHDAGRPSLVRMAIRFRRGHAGHLPDLVAGPLQEAALGGRPAA